MFPYGGHGDLFSRFLLDVAAHRRFDSMDSGHIGHTKIPPSLSGGIVQYLFSCSVGVAGEIPASEQHEYSTDKKRRDYGQQQQEESYPCWDGRYGCRYDVAANDYESNAQEAFRYKR